MRLSDITWTLQNKSAERSQVLYDGETLYILVRFARLTPSGVPVVPTVYSYTAYEHGAQPRWSGEDPADFLDNLHTHKMTPLELKCWRMEQVK
ncbi:hypothetical protein WYO_0153 [Methylobacterium sp. GXF4]|uniref:hypothetical protein n=1 Tax=Methylobacterium sp. GXF4 TaxID=1096546 RepID=UPI0002698C42|nr:hypothetical protein [Methylobacterium sp. GXF4]EIZ87116.1 hypothetical protein WYO_0153 [Methylobacterium sp. GXF4]